MTFSIWSRSLLLALLSSCALPPPGDIELGEISQGVEQALSSADKAVLNAPVGVWTYVPFPDTTCRDGSPSGVAVRRSATSNKLAIYLEGGGICFDAQTCIDGENPANTADQRAERTGGIFNRNNAANPLRDWNLVYVPYCSGDLHAGDRRNVVIPGVGTQQFLGRSNLVRVLRPVAKLFAKASDVLLTGSSAGGFGATVNFVPVQDAFKSVRVRLIDDSGPFLGASALATCLQKAWRTTFAWNRTFITDCGKRCQDRDDFMQEYAKWQAEKYADRPSGLISSTEDATISAFFGIGTNNCTGNFGTPVPGPVFKDALLQFRAAVKPYNYGSYYVPGWNHTFIEFDETFAVTVGGKPLTDWYGRIANCKSGGNVGP